MTMSSPSPTTTRDQQFCLRWNNYQSNLTEVFNELFQCENFVDVTLACEGHHVQAHRLVLAACSPYFLTVLTETPCEHPVIILQGVKWSELKAIVEFMYKGEINVCQDQISSLLRAAEMLKIRGLAEVGGEESEVVLTSPSQSPRAGSQFWGENTPSRKRRRLTEERRSRSGSRSPSPGGLHSPGSAGELMESRIEHPGPLSRGSSCASNPPPPLPSPSPVVSLTSSLSSLAHLHGPMPPPGPPLPPHLAHLPPMSPLSPLLNMHPMPRHHSPEDFDIRPGIAEMIREEERKRNNFPEMAKLLESSHHWIPNPMADTYQAQVQAAWQKSWNQTQSLLQNLRFRERGPLKSWRPETMAEAIHSVLKEGLSLSQAARKYDIPYPTFVLYANRVHNLLGPSHEPGDMRPKGRGRPQRILLGAWPDEQIKGVIRAVVFRDTGVFRDGDHKENKKPAASHIKEEVSGMSQATPNGPFTPNSVVNLTPNGTPDKSGNSTPVSHLTPSTSHSILSGTPGIPLSSPPTPSGGMRLPSPFKDAGLVSPDGESRPQSIPSSIASTSSTPNSGSHTSSSGHQPGHISTSSVTGPSTNQCRPSSSISNGPLSAPQQNGLPIALSQVDNIPTNLGPNINGVILPGLPSPSGGSHKSNSQHHLTSQHTKSPHVSPPIQQQLKSHQQQFSSTHNNPHFPLPNHLQPPRLPGNPLGPMPAPQQMLGLIAGGLNPSSIGGSPAHMARLFGEGPPHIHSRPPHGQMNPFHAGLPRPGHPGMPALNIHNALNSVGNRIDEHDPSPEAILFGKLSSSERHAIGQANIDIGARQIASNPFETLSDNPASPLDRPHMFRDALDTIKSEPEAIMN